ncbi:class II aldolase/adducin family protein [Oxalobacter vibrioformis]|uniref:Class II aldolase/adducin family protein n=1 Tax=Oxalobacter vibrioformis TaxID=933080 RepID=A0A9E9P4I7_9BURK|nr:class II aldolase/adducin family protein [Oxalobacter vibrioformis]WAW11143.1 class II aldolase/adducin family protein [Oxalobacter vibrioformis]
MNGAPLADNENTLRESLLFTTRQLTDKGLNRGTTGNVSVRLPADDEAAFLITPSGVPPLEMSAASMVRMRFSGEHDGSVRPSTEWQLHRDILLHHADAGAVIHVHSPFATTMACLHRDIPAFHYMIAVAGGDSIRCAPYALFGTQALSDFAIDAMTARHACLLANHGMLAIGRNLPHALSVAIEVEALCEQYWRILQIGEPHLLSDEQMQEVLNRFKNYGQWQSP